MKIPFIYRFLLFLLCLLLFRFEVKADGEEALDRTIRLPKLKGTVYSMLQKVSTESGYLFIYDSSVVRNDKRGKIKAGVRTLRQAIYEILGDENQTLKVVGNHILITQSEKKVVPEVESDISENHSYFTLTGTLLDHPTGEPIPNVSVILQGTSIGNVSNQNGEFKFHLPDSLKERSIVFSHLGYVSQTIEIPNLLGENKVLSLEPKIIPLQEVLIRLVDPKRLLRDMLDSRIENYMHQPVYLTTFYREGVQLKNKFQRLTEAVFKVYKPSLLNGITNEQVKLIRMSKLDNQEIQDSLAIKITAGIHACLELDIIKHIPSFLSLESNNIYVYTSGDVAYVEDRCTNVVHFEQRADVSGPHFCGELYIDSETNALLQARMEVNPKSVKNSANLFVVKSARNVRLIPQKVVYTVTYRPWENTYYVYHIRGDLYFKSKRNRYSLSSTTIHTWFEMVTCKVEKEQVVPFRRADRVPTHSVFSDMDFKYDASFWGDFNVIPLEEELSKVLEKISLKIEKIQD